MSRLCGGPSFTIGQVYKRQSLDLLIPQIPRRPRSTRSSELRTRVSNGRAMINLLLNLPASIQLLSI